MKNYIFGYGSLIEKQSRTSTTPDAVNAYPVQINGFVRGWWARTGVAGFSTTFLGCIAVGDAFKRVFSCTHVNGVVYEVSAADLGKTDAREKGYTRTEVPRDAITDYTHALDADAKVWVYLNQFSGDADLDKCLPDEHFPIVQSYADICLNGCLEIEEQFPEAKQNGFLADFIKSTQCWSGSWANDRIYPRRPFIYCPNAFKIDALLKQHLPGCIFDSIYIE